MTVLDRPAVSAPGPSAPRRGAGLLLLWWRRLTAMRTAIILLFLLALAGIGIFFAGLSYILFRRQFRRG